MNDDRWKSLLSFAQFILGTVVIGIFGTIINHQIQMREIEIKEQEQISQNLDTVLSANSGDKFLMAQFYAAVTRSDEIRKRWEIYRDELSAEIEIAERQREEASNAILESTDSKVIDQNQAIIQNIDAKITPGAKLQSSESLPSRIYFHIAREEQRQHAQSIATQLDSNPNLTIPGIQQLDQAPKVNELRYFKLSEASEAQVIAESLQALGADVVTKYIPGYESSQKLRPRHFELWLSSGWQ